MNGGMPKSVYALVGSDSFLQVQKLAEIRAELPADMQSIEVDGERAELAEVLDELRSFAMFGAGKLVIVRCADEFISRFREPLENYVAKPSQNSVLVLRCSSLPATQRIAKLIASVGRIEKLDPPKPRDLPQWIITRARSVHKLAIEPGAAGFLADYIGNDLGRLDNELAKLALQIQSGKVTAADVTGSVAFQREQEMWHMTDELTARRPAEALRRWRRLVQLDASTEFRAVTWLTMWLERLSKALAMKQAGASPFEIARDLKIWPAHQVDALLKTASEMGTAGIAQAVDRLAELDCRTKSGLGDGVPNIEQFILSLAGR